MNKELIIQLFDDNDSSRKRVLNDAFSEIIHMKASRKFITRAINRELARDDLVSEEDVKYCRHYFKQVAKPFAIPKTTKKIPGATPQVILSVESDEIGWSDPDEDTNQNKSVKSKFAK